jgi:hypothetical protein
MRRNEDDPAEIAASIGTRKGQFRLADLSPVSILSAVTMNEGFGKPRASGVVYLGLALICYVFASAMLSGGRLAYVIVPFVPIFAICGAWLIVTGQPVAVRRGKKIRLWKRVGLGLCLGVGVALGVAADALLVFGRP